MDLREQVDQAFAPDGVLPRMVPDFRPRSGQLAMAQAIAETIDSGGTLVVEAGTGVGKTYSYLVPALLSGTRVLLSTATKTLQDQLFGRDLPQLVKALGLPLRTALLKGRGSYLCLHRMDLARQSPALDDRTLVRTLAKIEQWSQSTRTGDLAELPGLDERSPVLPHVTSSRENCLGAQCPKFRACHVNLARREALAADVVVINHHLFFADLAVRESGMAELLPTVQTVIFDEAHQLNETGLQFLGRQLSTGQVIDFARDLLAVGLQQARGLVDWQQTAAQIERVARDLRMLAGRMPASSRLRWSGAAPDSIAPEHWQLAMADLHDVLTQADKSLGLVAEMGPDFERLIERAKRLQSLGEFFLNQRDPACVRWVDVGAQLRLIESPLDIAQAVQEKLLKTDADTPSRRSWIFTSATLGDEATLRWFTEPCGLTDARIVRVDSPFDYQLQAAVYVPHGLPRPADPGHSGQVASLVERLATEIGGRTLVLTTTLKALRIISEQLQQRFEGSTVIQVLVQGQGPKRELMERMRNAVLVDGPGCILVASASFWEGIDIPGEALQMVVIDKLPFPPPNDPLVEARAGRLEAAGRSPFNEYFIPEAAVALKQGAGRLVRRESDRGVLVLCDTRLTAMGYGRRLLKALPPMRMLKTEEELLQVLRDLPGKRRAGPKFSCTPSGGLA
jgi:ATP-dependent DNA helicase DinG